MPGADADRDDRLPSAMITISPWRSAKWAGSRRQPLGVDQQRAAHVERERERPQRALQRAVGNEAATSRPTPIAVLIASPQT